MSRQRLWREIAVTVGALIGSVCILLTVLGLFGVKPLVFTSGSMEPTISSGALALARETPASELKAGDVVSVLDADGVRVTHRVVSATPSGASTSLILKGDDNRTADVDPYLVSTGDRVILDVPYAGYAIAWASSRMGLTAGGMLLGLVLLAAFSPSQGPRHVESSRRRTAGRSAAAVGVIALTSQLSLVVAPTQAFWTDSAAASSTQSTVSAIPNLASSSCTNSSNGATVTGTWADAGARYRYQVTAHRTDTGAQLGSPQYFTTTSASLDPLAFASLATYQATGRWNFEFRVRALALNTTTWLSATPTVIGWHADRLYTRMDCGNDTSTAVALSHLGADTGRSQTDYITKTASNTLTGTSPAGDVAAIVIKRGGIQIATATADAAGDWTSSTFTLLSGSQTLTIEATDYIGNTASTTRVVVLDTTAPTVAQTPAACTSNGNSVAGVSGATWCKVTSRSVSMTATDDSGGSGIDTRELNDGGSGSTFQPYTAAVAVGEGNGRVVQTRATDVAGNEATVSATYYTDGTAPTVSVTSPTATTYSSASAHRTAVSNACGTANRVGCGTVTDTISGPSTTVVPRWKLLRVWTPLFSSERSWCSSSTGTYASGNSCTTTFASTFGTGGVFNMATSNSPYPDPGLWESDNDFTLTIVGATDAAGNVATDFVRQFTN